MSRYLSSSVVTKGFYNLLLIKSYMLLLPPSLPPPPPPLPTPPPTHMFSHGLANKTIERDQVFIFEQQWIDIFSQCCQKGLDFILFRRGVLDTTLCDKVCQWFTTGLWFSPGTPVSSYNKTDRQNITEILLKMALNSINHTPNLI